MLKKTVNYTDFDGNEVVEDCYFNLMQNELAEIAMDLPDGATDGMDKDSIASDPEAAGLKLLEALGNKGVFDFIKKLLLKSYGIRTPDGRGFKKTAEISEEFSYTLAFDTIFMELMSSEQAAADFVNNVISGTTAKQVADITSKE